MITTIKPRVAIDLRYQHFKHRVRDIDVFGTWYCHSRNNWEPCLALLPAGVRPARAVPCLVLLSNAWRWAEETCDHIECAEMALEFTLALGKNPGRNQDIIQVIETVRGRLLDLLMMPPLPNRPLELTGDVTITREGEVVMQRELHDDV